MKSPVAMFAHLAVGIVQARLRRCEQLLPQEDRFFYELPLVKRLRISAPVWQLSAKPIPKTELPGHKGRHISAKLPCRRAPRMIRNPQVTAKNAAENRAQQGNQYIGAPRGGQHKEHKLLQRHQPNRPFHCTGMTYEGR
jgi:hypothetical protein